MELTIKNGPGITILTGSVNCLSGSIEEYSLDITSCFSPGHYTVMAYRGTSETAIAVCKRKRDARNIIDDLTFKEQPATQNRGWIYGLQP